MSYGRQLYLHIQFAPRSKHSPCRLLKNLTVKYVRGNHCYLSCDRYKTLWATRTIFEYQTCWYIKRPMGVTLLRCSANCCDIKESALAYRVCDYFPARHSSFGLCTVVSVFTVKEATQVFFFRFVSHRHASYLRFKTQMTPKSQLAGACFSCSPFNKSHKTLIPILVKIIPLLCCISGNISCFPHGP